MKKAVFLIGSLLLGSFLTYGQQVQIALVNNGPNFSSPEGNLVLFYGNHQNPLSSNFDYQDFVNYAYADVNGLVSFNYGNLQPSDTITWVNFDCQRQPTIRWTTVANAASLQMDTIACRTLPCDALVNYRQHPVLGQETVILEKIALRASATTTIPGNSPANPAFEYRVHSSAGSSTPVLRALNNLDYDSIHILLDTNLSNGVLHYRYSRNWGSGCNDIADSVSYAQLGISGGSTPTPPSCNANFVVDTVNSGLFQAQLVVFETSTSSGIINSWTWDFGDGNSSNQRYPTHQYAHNGVYNVCLTITASDSTNPAGGTCTSTFCDSIGIDASGNVVYKGQSGFTLNIIDPATVNLEEIVLRQSLQLFPNPSTGESTLRWQEDLSVERVEVLNISGQRLQELRPQGHELRLRGLASGVFVIRVHSAHASHSRRLIVQ